MATIERAVFAAIAVLLAMNIASSKWMDFGTVTRDPECPDDSYNGSSVYYPDYTNCSKYYECSEGAKISMSCPIGLVWDRTNETCNYPEFVDCSYVSTTIGPPTNATSASTPSNVTVNPTSYTSSPAPTVVPTTAEVTTRGPTPTRAPGNLCEGIEDGEFIPYPQDCSEYIECVGGKQYFFKCPRDRYYDKKTGRCDSNSDDQC